MGVGRAVDCSRDKAMDSRVGMDISSEGGGTETGGLLINQEKA